MLPYTNSFKYLGMVCDKQINLNTAADATRRPFTAGTFRVKEFATRVNMASQDIRYSCWYVCDSDLGYSFLQQGKEMDSPLQK